MLRALLPVGLLLAVVAAVVVLVGCPPQAPKEQATPPPDTAPPSTTPEPAGTVNAEAAPTSNSEAAATGDVKTLAETKCGKCHPYAKAIEAKQDAAGWEKTVRAMSAKKAGWISAAEAAEITKYLAASYAK